MRLLAMKKSGSDALFEFSQIAGPRIILCDAAHNGVMHLLDSLRVICAHEAQQNAFHQFY
jgi:hypothetical protein